MHSVRRTRDHIASIIDRAAKELDRGRVFARASRRALRELQGFLTFLVLSLMKPSPGTVAIATLDAAEENASVTAAILGNDSRVSRIYLCSPDVEVARSAVELAALRLEVDVPSQILFAGHGYLTLLRAYARARQTYSTHVLLPGTDPSRRRAHVHLTHGSGPKPDTTFRGPTNILASIVDVWVPAQKREYQLPAKTPVLPIMPRLEVMRRATADRSIISKLGLDPDKKLVVWAPTYRAIKRAGGEIRTSGRPFSMAQQQEAGFDITDVHRVIESLGAEFIAKVHPFDADDLEPLGLRTFTTPQLNLAGVTSYELFGAADLLITDYSSVFTERAALSLPFLIYSPDLDLFAESYRGLREPKFTTLLSASLHHSEVDLELCLATSLHQEIELLDSTSSTQRLGINACEVKSTSLHLDLFGEVERLCF